MTCMTTKQKFEVEDPPVTVLSNGRYAYKVKCPWEGKSGKELTAFKFCSTAAYKAYCKRTGESEHDQEESERPPSPPHPY